MAMISRTQSQAATDAAALAIMQPPGGGTPAVEGPVAGRRYFEVNYPFATGGNARQYSDLNVNIQPDQVTVESRGNINAKLLPLGGINQVAANALSVVNIPTNVTPPDLDLVLVTDSSRSMWCQTGDDTDGTDGTPATCALNYALGIPSTGGPGSRYAEMVSAANNLVNTVMASPSPRIRFGLVEFASELKVKRALTSDVSQALGYVSAITLGTWTCGSCGMDGAIEMFSGTNPMPATPRPDGALISPLKFLILMSDGVQTCAAPGDPGGVLDAIPGGNCGDEILDDPDPNDGISVGLPAGSPRPFDDLTARCATLKSMGVNITTIAFGTDVQNPGINQDTLRDCASPKPDGSGQQFYLAPDYSALNNAMQSVARIAGRLRITQ